MDRILEPEIMNDAQQVSAYAGADFSSSNQLFVSKVLEDNSDKLKKILDIGCGPADIPIRIVTANPKLSVTAIDASKEMLAYAKKVIRKENLENKIRLIHSKVPGLTIKEKFDAVISKDLLHHLPNPVLFWEEIKRLSIEGMHIFVMDLIRPDSKEVAKKIVERISGGEQKILKVDFYNSLLAAFTVDEIRKQLKSVSLNFKIDIIGGRHFLVWGSI